MGAVTAAQIDLFINVVLVIGYCFAMWKGFGIGLSITNKIYTAGGSE